MGTRHADPAYLVPLDEGAEDRDARDRAIFVHLNLFAAIILQRFGLILGGSELYLCFVVFLGSVGMLLLRSAARVRLSTLLLYLLALLLFTASALFATAFPRAGVGMSIMSLVGVAVANIVFLFEPTVQGRGGTVLRTFIVYARVCGVLGIVQYLLQFVGVSLFTMSSYAPFLRPFLVEANYNTEGILAYGSSIHRANGVFLLEPGAFSQLIAIAVLIDGLVLKRYRFLPVYAVAYVLSYSGTGLLCLAITAVLVPVVAPRYAGYIFVALLALVPLGAAATLLFPSQVGHLAARSAELNEPGTSGYMRYVSQQQAWEYFSQGWRLLIGSGPGAFERSPVSVTGTTSTAVKVFAEYGVLGLASFAAFLIQAIWNARIALVSTMMLVVYQFGGGNLLQPPTLILMALLCIWPGRDQFDEPEVDRDLAQAAD
jgi:hypothetical protein